MGREHDEFRAEIPVNGQRKDSSRLQIQYAECQMPINSMPAYQGRGYMPPFDPRHPQDVPYQQRTGVPYQQLPPVEIYSNEPPMQGQRGRGQVQFSHGRADCAGGDGFAPDTYLPIDPRRVNQDAYRASQNASQYSNDRYSPYQYPDRQGNGQQNRYEYNQGTQERIEPRPYQNNPAESSYSGNSMDYMQITPQQFACDLQDGQMDMGRKLEQRLRFMAQHGHKRDVVPFMNEINRDLRAMGSPYYLGWQHLGDATFGSQRLAITFHGSKGLEVGFQL